MNNRRMCPHCRAFITTNDRVCPYCNETVGARAVERRAAAEAVLGFIPTERFATVMLVLVNLLLFAAEMLGSGDSLVRAGAESGVLVRIFHQYYRLITAGYLHGGLLHIGMNMWALFDLGAQVEEVYGPKRMFVLYTAATAFGFLTSAMLHPLRQNSLGASAGLFGLIGAMIALGVKHRHTSAGLAIRAVYVRWAIYGLLFGLLSNIDNWAHLGGLIAGFVVGYVAGLPGSVRSTKEQGWQIAAGACLLLTAYCFLQMYLQIGRSQV